MRAREVVEGLRYEGKNGKIRPAKEKQTQEIQPAGSQIFTSRGGVGDRPGKGFASKAEH